MAFARANFSRRRDLSSEDDDADDGNTSDDTPFAFGEDGSSSDAGGEEFSFNFAKADDKKDDDGDNPFDFNAEGEDAFTFGEDPDPDATFEDPFAQFGGSSDDEEEDEDDDEDEDEGEGDTQGSGELISSSDAEFEGFGETDGEELQFNFNDEDGDEDEDEDEEVNVDDSDDDDIEDSGIEDSDIEVDEGKEADENEAAAPKNDDDDDDDDNNNNDKDDNDEAVDSAKGKQIFSSVDEEGKNWGRRRKGRQPLVSTMGSSDAGDSFIDLVEEQDSDRENFRKFRRGLRSGEMKDEEAMELLLQMKDLQFKLPVYPGQAPLTLLRCVARYHRPVLMQWLLEQDGGKKKTTTTTTKKKKKTSLDLALHAALDRAVVDGVPREQLKTIELLLNAGAGLEAPRTPGGNDTPLFYAVAMGNNVAVVQCLCERGAKILGVEDVEGKSVFHVAVLNDMTECLAYLLSKLDSQQRNRAVNLLHDRDGCSPLEALVYLVRYHADNEDWERWTSVKRLIDFGSDVGKVRDRMIAAGHADIFDEFVHAAVVNCDSTDSDYFVQHLRDTYPQWAQQLLASTDPPPRDSTTTSSSRKRNRTNTSQIEAPPPLVDKRHRTTATRTTNATPPDGDKHQLASSSSST